MKYGGWKSFAVVGAAVALAAAVPLRAQGTITGRVIAAASSQPLPETRIIVIGSTISGTTGEDGKFTLRGLPAGQAQLQVLRVGYQSQKKTVNVVSGSVTNADFSLAVAIATLEEVVTTATGQQRRVELGNAVSTLGDVTKRVEETPNHSIADLLIAKSPGVTILPGTELGGAPSVRVRGVSSISLSNAPIWYVDGVRFATNGLSSGTDVSYSLLGTLNPEEIEDIEIVKGPSAATLYGTNAANGVILITTKKGRSGSTRFNWSVEGRNIQDNVPYQPMYANWGHDPKQPSRQIRCQLSTVQTAGFSVAQGADCISDSLTSYNWMTDPENTFVHTGKGSLYGLNMTGGNDAVRYFANANIDNEVGPIQMPWYDRQRFDSMHIKVRDEWFHPEAQQRSSFRGNLSAALSPKVDLNINAGFTKQDNRIPPESDLIIALYYVGMQNYGFKGPGLDKLTTQADGTPLHDALQWNPGDIMQVTQNQGLQRFTGSSSMSWRPVAWMQNEGTAGIDFAASNYFQLCRLNECPPQSTTARLGRITDNQSKFRNFSTKVSSTSTWNVRPWINLRTSFGGDYTNIETDNASTNGTTLPPGASTVGAASTRGASDQQPTAVKTLGAYVQEQASINDRLFLIGAIRTDQNSAFGSNFQKVYYPKISASWMLSDEAWFRHPSWMNSFRLRTAYGASGVQPGATAALVTFSAGTVNIPGRSSTATGGTDTPSLSANQPGNANLKPERSTETELGFESQLLSNRLRIDYTFWNKKTKDALININVASSSGAAQLSPLQNIGATQGWGHEVQANAQLIDRKNFGWDVLVTGSHFSNKVVDLGIDPNTKQPRFLGTGQTREIAGCVDEHSGAWVDGTSKGRKLCDLPIFSQWFRAYNYADDNHDGVLQKAEVKVDSAFSYFGYITPRDLVSVQSGFDLFARKLRINLMFDYKGGNSILDGANNFQCNTNPYACRDTQDPSFSLDRQAAAIAKQFGTVLGGTTYKTTVGYFRSNQFWKFREASAVWQIPSAINRRIRSQNGSTIVLGARNLHIWSSWTGIDPEANYGLSQTDGQSEFQTTGLPTYYTIRLNLKY